MVRVYYDNYERNKAEFPGALEAAKRASQMAADQQAVVDAKMNSGNPAPGYVLRNLINLHMAASSAWVKVATFSGGDYGSVRSSDNTVYFDAQKKAHWHTAEAAKIRGLLTATGDY